MLHALRVASLVGCLACSGPTIARDGGNARAAVIRVESAAGGKATTIGPGGGTAATLGEAINGVEELRAVDPTLPILIQFPAGTLRIGEAVELRALHGGTAASPLVIRGAPNNGSVLQGSVPLRPLSIPLPEAFAARLSAAARAQVRLYRLPPGALAGTRARRVSLLRDRPLREPLELYDEDGALRPARWPNEGWAEVQSGSQPPAEPGLTVSAPRASLWGDEPDLWVEGYLRQKWLFESVPVSRVEAESHRLMLGATPDEGVVEPGTRVRIVHALRELDAPGEWWRDPASGLLVAWPRNPDGGLEVAVTDALLRFKDVSHVRLEGVGLEYARGDALTVEGGEDVVVSGSRVAWVGGRGVVFAGARRGGIEHCSVTGTGGTGVRLASGDRATLSPSGLFMRGSHVSRFARLVLTQQAGLKIDGVGVKVRGNRFDDAGSAAIAVEGNDHHIIGNAFSHLLAGSDDSGAIYAGRDWTAQGTVIENNVLSDIRADAGLEVKGIYLDDFASGFTIRDNLFLRVDQPVFIGGGRDNLVAHNVFVASSPAAHVDSRGEPWSGAVVRDPESELRYHNAAMPVSSAPWRRYPDVADILRDEPQVGKRNRIEDNAVVLGQPFDFSDGGNRARQIVSRNVGPDGLRSASGRDLRALAQGAADPAAFSDLVDEAGRRVGLERLFPSPSLRTPANRP